MSAPVAKVLRGARDRIADEKDWCSGIDLDPPGDCKECALTALGSFMYDQYYFRAERALLRAAAELYPTIKAEDLELHLVAYVNDTYGHTAAMRMYERAIENEEGLS